MKTLVVLGASGLMGQRIVRIARDALPDARVIEASRSAAEGDASKRIALSDGNLAAKLRDVDCLVNAVGPYDYDPGPLLAACVEARCHYVDIAESPEFCEAVGRRGEALDPAARGVAIATGCSTVPGLVELIARHDGAPHEDAARTEAWLSMGSRNPTSSTLLFSLLRTIRGRTADGAPYFDRVVRRESVDGRRLAYARYPFPDEARGVRADARWLPVTFRVGFDRAPLVSALVAARPLVERLPLRLLAALARLANPLFALVARLGTTRGCLEVIVRDSQGEALCSTSVLAQREGLDVPAAPAVWAARSLMRDDAPGGLFRLADLVTFDDARRWLGSHGYEVVAGRPGAT